MNAVHQLLPSFHPYDAVGAHAHQLRELLRSMGLHSEIYALEGSGTDAVLPLSRFSARGPAADTALVYQLATGSPMRYSKGAVEGSFRLSQTV